MGPGIHYVNLTLAKNFTIKGQTKLQLRMDTFNLFNTKNLGTPTAGITASNFGVITGAVAQSNPGGPRTAQVGLRLTF
jgi:hypothetical protein